MYADDIPSNMNKEVSVTVLLVTGKPVIIKRFIKDTLGSITSKNISLHCELLLQISECYFANSSDSLKLRSSDVALNK